MTVDKILRKPEIEEITGFTERHVRDMEAAGNFPRRFRPDPDSRSVGWLASEVSKWMAGRAATREIA